MTRMTPHVAFDKDAEEHLNKIIARHVDREGPLLPILHDIQADWGMIPEAAQPILAQALNVTRAEIYGVVSFYHDFRDHPSAPHVLRLCRAESCQSMGADELADQICKALGISWHETTADGKLTLEPVFCLGLCACAPSAELDGKLIGRASKGKIERLVAGVRA
ncbi:formate dehydrogenase subunit gamma [Paracoccus aminophilus]|nr:formate dehydrogenase subunit gamma [Paracoccus aminophilus]